MLRPLVLALSLVCAAPAIAQDVPGTFPSLDAYDDVVSAGLVGGDFMALIGALADLAPLTEQNRINLANEMAATWAGDYTNTALVLREEMENGFTKEVRAFWTDTDNYGYYFGLLHNRGDEVRVLQFGFNATLAEVLSSL